MLTKKREGLDGLLVAADKRFGKGTLMRMDGHADDTVTIFSTGSVGLDLALGTGGLPRGRVVEIYGPESSGKTTLSLQAVAEIQRAGEVAAFVDAEHALDLSYAKALGVDPERLLVAQPDCGEDALDLAELLVRSGEVGLVVVDSVAALTPRVEIDGEMGDAQVGLQARLMAKALRKLNAAANQSGTTLIFINQLRQKIGVVFGPSETTTGGNSLKYYASVRLDIRRIGAVKNGQDVVGNRTRVKVVKNKLASPFRVCEFDIIFGRGVCVAGELIDLGVDVGVVEKSGSWFSSGGERLGQGREKARDTLLEQPERLAALRRAVLEAALGVAGAGAPDATAGDAAARGKKAA